MIRVKIYCSIRTDNQGKESVKLFVDLKCAEVDQELQPHFKQFGPKNITHFTLVVDGATVYIEEVTTKKEYLLELQKELKLKPDNKDLKEAINKVKSFL